MWLVTLSHRVAKKVRDRSVIPIEVESAFIALIAELEFGPDVTWPNYGKLKTQKNRDFRHCHLKKGHPTWVVCWQVFKKSKRIEVYYVGTHEKAPY